MKFLTGHRRLCIFLFLVLANGWSSPWLQAGVRREIQDSYRREYENKAMFLKIPVRGARQLVYVRDSGPVLDRSNANLPLLFQVGDQIRIIGLDFQNEAVRLKVASVDLQREVEITFRFSSSLQDDFSQRDSFDAALKGVFTPGLTYTELDSAKQEFVQSEFTHFVERLARSSNTSEEAVIASIGKEIPIVASLEQRAGELSREIQQAQQQLAEERKTRESLQSQLSRLRQEGGQKDSELVALRAEREKLARDFQSLQRSSRNNERQIQELVSNLNIREASAQSLGRQIELLNESIESLKQERTALGQRAAEAENGLKEQQEKSAALAAELKQTENQKNKLLEDIRAMTSNRNSLEARYMETKKAKEELEQIARLEASLRLEKRLVDRDGSTIQMTDLYLLTKKIGTFEIPIPDYPGKVYEIRYASESPDTVKFSEEERELFGRLGEKLQMETAWQSAGADLQMVLLNKQPLQEVGVREEIDWPWLFQGEVTQPETVTLDLNVLMPGGQKIFLGSQDFTVWPGQTWARVRRSISPISLLAGALVGVIAFGIIFGFGTRSSATKKAKQETSRESVVLQKKF